jgi:hypothetical protein
VPDRIAFELRFTFVCTACKRLNDQQTSFRAKSREAAQEHASRTLIRCKFCRAKIGANDVMTLLTGAEPVQS